MNEVVFKTLAKSELHHHQKIFRIILDSGHIGFLQLHQETDIFKLISYN